MCGTGCKRASGSRSKVIVSTLGSAPSPCSPPTRGRSLSACRTHSSSTGLKLTTAPRSKSAPLPSSRTPIKIALTIHEVPHLSPDSSPRDPASPARPAAKTAVATVAPWTGERTQPPAYLRDLRGRTFEQLRLCGRPGRGGAAGHDLQPAVHLRRGRSREDPHPACHPGPARSSATATSASST